MTRRALIIEDDPTFVDILTRFLRTWDLEIATADSAAGARQQIEAADFDIVLADLKLPRDDGPEVLRMVERVYPELAAKTVVVTGFPILSGAFRGGLPVVDKSRLTDLGPHLVRILGEPAKGRG